MDRTNWRLTNLMVVSLIYDKRAIPVYIQIINKQGSRNLEEQKQVPEPVIRLLKDDTITILGDREFCSVKLGNCLQEQCVGFSLRLKKNGLYYKTKRVWPILMLQENGNGNIVTGSRMKVGLSAFMWAFTAVPGSIFTVIFRTALFH